MRVIVLFGLLISISLKAQVRITPGMKINASLKIDKAIYQLNANPNQSIPVIEVSGENIVVDLNNATLKGSNDNQKPNEFYGLAVLVRDGKNITLRNLRAKGYKVAIMGRNVEGLVIENCDLSYNYRQHLNSTQEKEDISDWMSYHHNEKDQWLRYGAAIYLRGCNKAIIHDNIVTGGQCALMMTESNDCKIYSNNFSYNSGLGIGMYRSSRNKVFYNKLDFNVRGFSHGIYSRGQDSAGILVFEQCNDNVFAHNSATHCGDGFFLWAGQFTMDSGEGGCNNNLIYHNDFSYAPTNGIEVTFSKNLIEKNIIKGCDHGIWGGYSYSTTIFENKFEENKVGIAIEHGQQNWIMSNSFTSDQTAIKLWSRARQPSDWGYAKKRNVQSRSYQILANRFWNNQVVFDLMGIDSLKSKGNIEMQYGTLYKMGEDVMHLDTVRYDHSIDVAVKRHLGLANIPERPISTPKSYGRNQIRITEWGPYDFRYPLLWRTNPADTSGLLKFEVIGPKGKWKLVRSKGVKGITATSGTVPAVLRASRIKGSKEDIFIELEYLGLAITDQFGTVHAANKPYRFYFRDARVPLSWEVKWYAYDSSLNPVSNPDNWNAIVAKPPARQERTNSLEYAWWGGIKAGSRTIERFVTQATTGLDVLPGTYELSTTWDDAVRVYLDGKLILDEWNPSQYTFDESPNKTVNLQLDGHHSLRVEHVELGGFATLAARLRKL